MRALGISAVLIALAFGVAASQELPEWRLVEEVRIGSIDAADALTGVGDLRIGPDDRIFLWQGMSNRMLVYDSSGVRSHSVGRRGAGPGEFMGRLVRWTWKGDTLAAFDQDQQRYSLFLPDGKHVRTGRILPEGSLGTVVLEALLADGSALGRPRGRVEESAQSPRIRYAPDGSTMDTVVAVRGTGGGAGVVRLPRGLVVTFRPPLPESDQIARDPLGQHLTVVERSAAQESGSATFRVYRVGLEGDTLFDRHFRYVPHPVDEAWADSVEESFRDSWAGRSVLGGRLRKGEIDQLVSALAIPDHFPPVSETVVDRSGRVWLKRAPASGKYASWLVVDDQGRLLASATGPSELKILNARDAAVWGVVHDDLDVPYVVRYRVDRVH